MLNQLSPELAAQVAIVALVAWLATTLIILILVAIDRRRQKRLEALAKQLHTQAQSAVIRHQWARGAMGSRDDWIIFNRQMENLAEVVQRLEQEPAR